MGRWLWGLGVILWVMGGAGLAGCSGTIIEPASIQGEVTSDVGEDPGTHDGAADVSEVAGEVAADVTQDEGGGGIEDADASDAGAEDVPLCEGCTGWPCETPDDCDSGWCVEGPEGMVCAATCTSTCPVGYQCKQVSQGSSDVAFICVYSHLRYCRPCEDASDCEHPLTSIDAYCLPDAQDPLAGSFCATGCDTGAGCPEGAACVEVSIDGGTAKVCRPADEGLCECGLRAIKAGATTSCGVANESGTCMGHRSCTAEGLSACDAATPEAEVCDEADNDCDGGIDEDFSLTLADGTVVYGTGKPCGDENCGGGLTICDPDTGGIKCSAKPIIADEVCDGVDNDCDGLTDADDPELVLAPCELQGGICAGLNKSADHCASGAWKACTEADYLAWNDAFDAGGETECDGLDTDCDGLTDAADPQLIRWPCDKQEGVCAGATRPVALCVEGEWLPCDTAAYVAHNPAYQADTESKCDALDNDCDGQTDEDFALTLPDGAEVSGVGTACGVGACAGGTTECNEAGNGIACPSLANAGSEVCDGEDNDCDGKLDAADGDLAPVLCEKQEGVCAGAPKPKSLCVDGDWQPCADAAYAAHNGYYQPEPESACDAKDNDCDGTADEALSTDADGDGHYAKGSCLGPADDCDDGDVGNYPGNVESCDGDDDNCDEVVDPEGSAGCVAYYSDADDDGYGTGSPECLCAASGNFDTTTPGDCYDANADAKPGQTTYFADDRGDSSFDYNCDTVEDKESTVVAECALISADLGICEGNSGWDSAPPACGADGNWQSNCHWRWWPPGCVFDGTPKTMKCR